MGDFTSQSEKIAQRHVQEYNAIPDMDMKVRTIRESGCSVKNLNSEPILPVESGFDEGRAVLRPNGLEATIACYSGTAFAEIESAPRIALEGDDHHAR